MEYLKLRRRICFEAAQLLHSRRETNFTQARWRAARGITSSYVSRQALPTDMEIRAVLQQLASTALSEAADDMPACRNSEVLPASRFDDYFALLEPLDCVRLDRDIHPEGDLLYHCLQVFELARDARPWDEDFLLAALLHDVGRGIDPYDGQGATLAAVEGIVSERTLWFIENLPTQHRVHEGTIGIRARRRLSQHDDGEELRLLAQCDSDGRVPGRVVSDLGDAIEFIRNLNQDG